MFTFDYKHKLPLNNKAKQLPKLNQSNKAKRHPPTCFYIFVLLAFVCYFFIWMILLFCVSNLLVYSLMSRGELILFLFMCDWLPLACAGNSLSLLCVVLCFADSIADFWWT